MIAENPPTCRNTSKGIQVSKKMKTILLSFHERFLNFKENIGISETNNQENKHAKATNKKGWINPATKNS